MQVLQVALLRECNMQLSDKFVQLIIQQVCNMNIKQLASQVLKRVKIATPIATDMQQALHKVQLPCNTHSQQTFVSTRHPHVTNKKVNSKKIEWQDEEKDLIAWFNSVTDLPNEAFQLKDAIQINCPQKFYDSLREEIDKGPSGARALFGSIQNDLLCLKKLMAKQ